MCANIRHIQQCNSKHPFYTSCMCTLMKVYCSQHCSGVCDLIVVNVQMPKEKRRELTQAYHFQCCRVTSSLTVSYTGRVRRGSRAQSVPCKTKKAGQTARQSGVKARTKAKRNTVMVNCELLESTLCHLLFTLPRALKSSVFDHVCLRKAYSAHAYISYSLHPNWQIL